MDNIIENALKAIKNTSCHTDDSKTACSQKLWDDYFSFVARHEDKVVRKPLPHHKDIVEFLSNEGILKEGSKVLDIGAGTGKGTVEFCKKGAFVHAVDLGEQSLKVLETKVFENGFQNQVTIQRSTFSDFQTTNEYHISYVAMCPAICNMETLEKMMNVTKGYCCILTVAKGSFDLHRRKVLEIVKAKDKPLFLTEVSHYYNLLYQMGKNPNVRNFCYETEETMPLEIAIERYQIYGKIFSDNKENDQLIREYFEKNSENGYVTDRGIFSTALIYFKGNK